MSLPGTNVEITFNNVVVNVPVVVGIQTSGLPIDVVVRYGASRLTAVQGVDYTIDWEGNNPALPGADLTHFNITPLSGLLAKIAISGPNVIYVRRELPLVEDFDYDDAFIRQKLVDQFDRTWMVLQQLGFRFGEIGAIVEAPTDGQQYGRQSAGWTVIAPNPTWTTLTGKPATFPPTLPILESDVTNLVSDLALKAPLASPVFTGNPTAPTATPGDNDTSIATTAFVTAAVGLVNIPPATVAPLMDGVAAVGVTTKYAREDHRHPSDTAKLDAASYTAADVLTKIKTVDGVGSGLDADLLDGASGAAYLDRANHTGTQAESTVTNLVTDLAAKAPLASPVFTGDPTAPTPLTADNDTSIATKIGRAHV